MTTAYRKIVRDGLWEGNMVFSQNIALCPLLAVTGTASNGLGMGLATTAVLAATNGLIAASRVAIPPEIRIPVFVLLIAVVVTLVDMFMNAWLHELYKVLGLFIPLIVTNCGILGRAEAFAFRNPLSPSLLDGLMMGLGFTLALVLLGAAREIAGTGMLFSNAALLLGDGFAFLEIKLIEDYRGFLLMALPPGGFIMLGFLLAGKRLLHKYLSAVEPVLAKPAEEAA